MNPCASGTATKPREFLGVEVSNLPVHYYHNKSASIDREISYNWFRKKFIQSVRQHLKSLDLPQKAVLLLDNASSHPNEDILKSEDGNIFVKYLPPNVTALVKLMDLGVAQNTKTPYRKKLLQKIVTEGTDLLIFFKNMTVLDAIYEITAAWNLIKGMTLKKILVENTAWK
jgi:hypothetical protein